MDLNLYFVSEGKDMPKIENLQDLRKIKESAAKQMVSRREGQASETAGRKDGKNGDAKTAHR